MKIIHSFLTALLSLFSRKEGRINFKTIYLASKNKTFL